MKKEKERQTDKGIKTLPNIPLLVLKKPPKDTNLKRKINKVPGQKINQPVVKAPVIQTKAHSQAVHPSPFHF